MKNVFLNKETKRIKDLENDFSSKNGFNSVIINMRYDTLKDFFKGTSCLEVGSADGQGTKHLLKHFNRVVALDASSKYTSQLREQFKTKKLEVVCSLIEDYKTDEKFDTVVLAHILEHVDNPVKVLKFVKKYMKPKGVLLIDVPSATSIHRMIGVKMGHLKKITDLHEGDVRIGHRRVYTMEALIKDINKSGLTIKKTGGVLLKPLSNAQIEKSWDKKLVRAFYDLGKDLPQFASEIYAVCKL